VGSSAGAAGPISTYPEDMAMLVGAIFWLALALVPLVVLALLVGAPSRWRERLPVRIGPRPEPAVPARRPLSDVASDARRLSERYHQEGMRFAQYEGRRQAFDRVLAEAAEMLEVANLLDVLAPGPELDRERTRVEDRLVQAGLLLHRAEPT
jgi:hypothetical protein